MNKKYVHIKPITLPCGSERTVSSHDLRWPGILLEQHTALAQPGDQSTFPYLLVEIASGKHVALGERAIQHVGFRRYKKLPGMTNFYTEGVRPALRPSTTTELTLCAIRPELVEEIAQESDVRLQLQQTFGSIDPSITSLVMLLRDEARAANPTGHLYVDSLIHALVLRLGRQPTLFMGKRNVPLSVGLKRVINLLHENPTANYRLEELAHESGYSRSQFIKRFHEATGAAPHTYLLRLRVAFAESLIRDESLRLTDVALQAGFTSLAHMARSFRVHVQQTPSELRTLIRHNAKRRTLRQR